MNYRIYVYVLVVLLTTFAISGLDLNRLFKKGKVIEANIFVIILIIAISELVSSFIINFLEVSKILWLINFCQL